MSLIGRKREIQSLENILASKQAEFVAVYGRRRVGKTYLIQQCLADKGIYLECTGMKEGTLKEQLANFIKKFQAVFYPTLSLEMPKTWQAAFELFTTELKKAPPHKKVILFLDELPWLATRKSRILQNLDYFWNTEWSKVPNFKLVVCGSAASWILNNLINAKGGLYNRITKSIHLDPLSLNETQQYLDMKGVKLNHKQVLDLYLVMGGIPFYLNQVQRSLSVNQNIDEICFKKDGLLFLEFPRLFKSLFDSSEAHYHIVRAIAKHRYGLSLSELGKKLKRKIGGRFRNQLAELEMSGFIQGFLPYQRKKRDRYYKIIDEYTMFYLHWIEAIFKSNKQPSTLNYWVKALKTPAWQAWAGYAFEAVCLKHVSEIIKKLKLDSIGCLMGSWRFLPPLYSRAKQGAQIDLLLDREDNAITLCEMKYTENVYTLDKAEAKNLINKLETFQQETQTKKQIFVVLISTMGIKENVWSEDLISDVVTLKDFFNKY